MASPVWHFLNGVPVIPVAQIGTTLAGDGSATAPSYSFADDADTGFYSPSNGIVRFASDGSDALIIGAGLTLHSAWMLQWGSSGVSSPDTILSRGAANRLDLATGDSFYAVSGGIGAAHIETTSGSITATRWNTGGLAAAATTAQKIIKKITGMADAAAVDVFTVTVPNAGQSAGIKVMLLSSNGSTDAFESSRVAEGFVVLARTSGVATVATVATLEMAQIATVGSGATHTLAYGVSSIVGLASATQTFTITVTINDSGNLGSNQVVAIAELLNSEASGVTIA